jgi:hypothetical protein
MSSKSVDFHGLGGTVRRENLSFHQRLDNAYRVGLTCGRTGKPRNCKEYQFVTIEERKSFFRGFDHGEAFQPQEREEILSNV